MNEILYISIDSLLNDGILDYKAIRNEVDIIKLSICIDSILMNIPLSDLVINKSSKNIVRGLNTVQYLYCFIKKDVRLCNKSIINKNWRNKKFSELEIDLKKKILSANIRVICIDEKLNIYY